MHHSLFVFQLLCLSLLFKAGLTVYICGQNELAVGTYQIFPKKKGDYVDGDPMRWAIFQNNCEILSDTSSHDRCEGSWDQGFSLVCDKIYGFPDTIYAPDGDYGNCYVTENTNEFNLCTFSNDHYLLSVILSVCCKKKSEGG